MIVKHCKQVCSFKITFLRSSHQVRYVFKENGGLVAYQDSEKLPEWEAVLWGGKALRTNWECVGMTPSLEGGGEVRWWVPVWLYVYRVIK